LYNVHKAEKQPAKNEDDLMNDRADEIISQIQGLSAIPGFDDMPFDEQREHVKRMIMRDMGVG
jgi:transcriptional regulator of met regulon